MFSIVYLFEILKKLIEKKILNKYNEFSFKKKRRNELKLEKKLLSKREIELNE